MKLMKYSISILAENEDVVAASLYDCEVEGVEIEDSIPLSEAELKHMFVDIPKDLEDNDGKATLSFYLDDEDENTDEILKKVRDELNILKDQGFVSDTEIKKTDISSINWQDNWKKYFKPFQIDHIYIVPTWEDHTEFEGEDRIVIRVDPGSAFGTGKHETTRLCIREMKEYLKEGKSILDVGTGSGILGIIGLKLGASEVNAIDIDENVLTAIFDNLENNDINHQKFNVRIGDITKDEEMMAFLSSKKHDVIIANILPNILEMITPSIRKLMHKESVYILSGILDVKVSEVEAFLKANQLKVIAKRQEGEWVAITAVME